MTRAGTLALDASTRNIGWAVEIIGRNTPQYGLYTLPGMADRGLLYRRTLDSLEELVERFNPERFIYAKALFDKAQTAARALAGVQAMIDLCAANCGIVPNDVVESTARKLVLGRGSFGIRDPKTGGLVPGGGRKDAKATVMAWADRQGYKPVSDDVADALVLLEYDRLIRTQPLAPRR